MKTDNINPKSQTEISCRLTPLELQKRKARVIQSLKQQIIQVHELPNGYAFKFSGTDNILDELTLFIKTERACCSFFTFTLSVYGNPGDAWLTLTGAEGAKDFLKTELQFII